MKVEITEPKITKCGRMWKAEFVMWLKYKPDSIKMDMDYYAPTKERLLFKIEHLKKTGIMLRD